ncbi:hypothetical protein JCM10207_008737 [Rhodosporidiobolus poonsookiae]
MNPFAEPPLTPVTSTASSFLSFSPEAPHTPYSPERTPRAQRRLSAPGWSPIKSSTSSAFDFGAPPQRNRTASLTGSSLLSPVGSSLLSPVSGIFGDNFAPSPSTTTLFSRNPFAAILAAQSASLEQSSSTSRPQASHSSDSSSSSSSNASTPTQGSLEDDVVIYDGSFVNAVDSLVFPSWASGPPTGDSVLLGALSTVGYGDASSAWGEELYSSLSDSAPASPFTLGARRGLPSPSKTPRAGSSSPRKRHKSPKHPYHASSSSPVSSPRRSAPSPPSRSRRSPRHSGNVSSRRPSAVARFSPVRASASLVDGFQLHPTSPLHPKQRDSGLPFSNFALVTGPFARFSPPRTKRSKSKSRAVLALEDKLVARAERRRARIERELAEEGRPIARTAEGFDAEALDLFFGTTPKMAKALRGGYAGVAAAEGLLRGGDEGEERERWRRDEEFRALLDAADEEDADVSSAAEVETEEEDDLPASQRRRRHRPPPLTLAHSSHSRSGSTASSFHADQSALSSPSSSASPAPSRAAPPRPLTRALSERKSEADLRASMAKGLKHKRSIGDMLKDLFVGGK